MRNIWKLLAVLAVVGSLAACEKNEVPAEPKIDDGTTIINGHMAVDLGLSVKWASCNVGAYDETGYGFYFAWGETAEKTNYDWLKEGDYKWGIFDESARPIFGMTKYTADEEGGDGLKTLLPEDDPATVNWGGKWRTPTFDEIEELLDETKCEWTWDAARRGCIVKGLRTGKSIFLPAAGYWTGSVLDWAGKEGNYWSSSVKNSVNANFFWFGSDANGWNIRSRCLGKSVRAVTDY